MYSIGDRRLEIYTYIYYVSLFMQCRRLTPCQEGQCSQTSNKKITRVILIVLSNSFILLLENRNNYFCPCNIAFIISKEKFKYQIWYGMIYE